jgi:RHS repeat-associated protein
LGFAGEWQNTYFESGLLYLRARWYAVKVGRFTSPDPIIADFHDPRSINRYVYVLGNPIILIDPSGLQACASYCGPDITDWFAEEVRIHWNWIQTEKGAFTAETERLYRQCLSASASETCIALHTARTEQWLISFRDYAKAIPYKWMRFRHLVPDCPTLDCWFTATLCDTCLQRSELGNIMFGFAANLWGWPAELAHSIAFLIGALQEQWDKASAGIGYHLAEGYVGNGSSSSEAMCSSMKASQGTRAFPQARWENIQDPHIEGCQSCEVPVPPSTPHSTPAFAGAPSGYRDPWAGAPNYEYYTEQIPVGMLDPLMLDPRLPGILK